MPAPQKEADHQKRAVEYVRGLGYGHLLVMIPNGTQLPGGSVSRAKYMASLKRQGLRPGASDLFLAKPVICKRITDPLRGVPTWYHGAWFEMKRDDKEQPSQAQLIFLGQMANEGYWADVCYGFDDFRSSVDRYLAGELPLTVIRYVYETHDAPVT